jgi:hypothetical protein
MWLSSLCHLPVLFSCCLFYPGPGFRLPYSSPSTDHQWQSVLSGTSHGQSLDLWGSDQTNMWVGFANFSLSKRLRLIPLMDRKPRDVELGNLFS